MTIKQIETELLSKIVKLEGTHNVFQQGEIKQCRLVLDMLSKLHQPAVIKSVCDNEWHESNMQHFGECHACGLKVEY